MLAAAERAGSGAVGEAVIVGHVATGPASGDGDCAMHAIVCGELGVGACGGDRGAATGHDEPGQRWCTARLHTVRRTA